MEISTGDNSQLHTGSGGSDNVTNKKFTWRSPSLIAVIVIFVAVGIYLLVSSSADTLNGSKVWSTAADWDAGTLNNASVSGNTVSLTSHLTPSTSTTITPSTDLALHRPVYASSTSTGNNNNKTAMISLPASNVNDGNLNTRWSSNYSDPQSITIDLGRTYSIKQVKLNWEVAYAKSYKIQVSNNARHWQTIYSTTSGTGGVNNLTGLNGSGRYIRMLGLKRGTQYGYSLWEMAVYGPAITTTTTINTTTYPTSGTETLTYDASRSVNFTSLSPQATTPASTAVSYQARTSSNDSTWSSWYTVPANGSLSTLASNRYIQIQATLSTTNTATTPILSQLVLNYTIPVASPTISLSASTSAITSGDSTTLSWTSTNATTCTASGGWSGTDAASGSIIEKPTSTTTYNLSCSGDGGTVTAPAVTVTVTPAPVPVVTSSADGCTSGGVVAPCILGASSGAGASTWGTPKFDDEFSGTSLDTSRWIAIPWSGNSAANVTVSSGDLVLTAPSAGSSAQVSSGQDLGAGANGYQLPIGGVVEVRAEMPVTNVWATIWATSDNGNWPAGGEVDIAEGNSANYQTNYHDAAGAQNALAVYPSSVVDTWHTYTFVRGSGTDGYKVYLDGKQIAGWTGGDNGDPQSITLSLGNTSGSFPAKMLVDYVRAWQQ